MTVKLLFFKPSYLPFPLTKIDSVFCYGQNIPQTFSSMIASQLPVTETRPEQTKWQLVGKCWKNPSTPPCKEKRGKKSEKYRCSAHFNFYYIYILIDLCNIFIFYFTVCHLVVWTLYRHTWPRGRFPYYPIKSYKMVWISTYDPYIVCQPPTWSPCGPYVVPNLSLHTLPGVPGPYKLLPGPYMVLTWSLLCP